MEKTQSERMKGNKYAVGNKGLSKKWKTKEDLQQDIDAYFELCDNTKVHVDKEGNAIFEPYTVEGLALTLGCDMDTLRNYEKTEGYEEYFGTVKNAKLRIQKQKVVNGMVGKSHPSITIFDLKNNHGYKDKNETDHTTKGESMNIVSLGSGINPDK